MSRAHRVGLALACAFVCSASTCDNQDVTARRVLSFATGDGPAVLGFEQPSVGRLTVDYGLRNTGAETSIFEIAVQSQTLGTVDEGACEDALANPPRALVATSVDGDDAPPLVRALDRLHAVTLPDGEGSGLVDVRLRQAGSFRFFTGPGVTEFSLSDTNDAAVSLEGRTGDLALCEELATAWDYELAEGTARLALAGAPGDTVSLLVEETCESTRSVPRTCPGSADAVVVEGPIQLDGGGFVSGRIESLDVGVGDLLVVSVGCDARTPDCAAELEVFVLIEQLDCRVDNDCRANRACSEDGYCLRIDTGGCAAAGEGAGGTIGAGVLLLLGLLVAARRRWTGAFVVTLLFLSSPPADAAEPGLQVYFQPGITTYQFTGDVGQFASGSIGLEAMQGVQYGLIGAYLSLGTDYYLTNQPPPPYTRGLQTLSISTGLRLAIPVDVVTPFIGIGYTNLGVVSNALTRFTGEGLSFDALSGHAAGRVRLGGPLYVEGAVHARHFFNMATPTWSYGFAFSFGLAGSIR